MNKEDTKYIEKAYKDLAELDIIIKELESPFSFFVVATDRQKRLEDLENNIIL
ncbi:MAG: hypothetical protein KAT66_00645 [Candidatus Lokiarchaeota archaeon]|nr:hypothetical protein [Candidatus Lokiarchaeota archaeon]